MIMQYRIKNKNNVKLLTKYVDTHAKYMNVP